MGKLLFEAEKDAEAYDMFENAFKMSSQVFGESSFYALLAKVRMIALDKTPRTSVDVVKNILELLGKAEQLQPGDWDVLNTHQFVAQWLVDMGRVEEGCELALDHQVKFQQRFGNQNVDAVRLNNDWVEKVKRMRDLGRFVAAMSAFGLGNSD